MNRNEATSKRKRGTPAEIASNLGSFTGTTAWHRYNGKLPTVVLTDGAKYVAQQCYGYWVMDLIAIHTQELIHKGQDLYCFTWIFEKNGDQGKLTCEDGNGNILWSKGPSYMDFRLDSIKLLAMHSAGWITILLPSEK